MSDGYFEEFDNDSNRYLAITFYTAVGIVATLVIIIIIMAIGYCYLARYLVKRNRLMNRYTITIYYSSIDDNTLPSSSFEFVFRMYRKVKLLTSPQEDNDDIIELEVDNTTLKPGEVAILSFESWSISESYILPVPVK